MNRMMWFGPKGFETWVRMPRIDMDSQHSRTGQRFDQIRGGVSVRMSAAGHQEYGMTWNPGPRDEIALIQDIADGLYDSVDDDLIYFVDPAAMDTNMLSRLWAAPWLCGKGAPSLTKGTRPTLAATPANAFRLPPRTATFTTAANTPMLALYVPIPPGATFRFGFYGPSAQASKIRYRPVNGTVVGAAVTVGVLANTAYGTGLTAVAGSATVTGILLDLNPVVGTVALTAGIARLDAGIAAPAPQRYISGRGHSGCSIEPGSITSVVHNVRLDRASTSLRLIERGSWL